MIQQLHAVERKTREEALTAEQTKELRLKGSLKPDRQGHGLRLRHMGQGECLPVNGNLQIDNNLCENALRGVALGRKN